MTCHVISGVFVHVRVLPRFIYNWNCPVLPCRVVWTGAMTGACCDTLADALADARSALAEGSMQPRS